MLNTPLDQFEQELREAQNELSTFDDIDGLEIEPEIITVYDPLTRVINTEQTMYLTGVVQGDYGALYVKIPRNDNKLTYSSKSVTGVSTSAASKTNKLFKISTWSVSEWGSSMTYCNIKYTGCIAYTSGVTLTALKTITVRWQASVNTGEFQWPGSIV